MRIAAILMVLTAAVFGQSAEEANRSYQSRESRAAMARNLGAEDRVERLQGKRIVESLELKQGMAVADLGTGAGVMLPLLSAAVGPQGNVFAQDIHGDFLEQAKKRGGANVETVLGTEKDPKLPAGCCDVIVTIDAYHHLDYPKEMLAGIRRALKPGGRFVIVDYYKRPGAMSPGPDAVQHVRLDVDDVVKEVEAAGFRKLETRDHIVGKQWIGFFTPR